MDAWNPIIEVDPQVEQAVKDLENEVLEEKHQSEDLPWFLIEQAL